MISQLSLDILDTCNVKTLRVADSSWYNKKITVECGSLEVTPPGYANAVAFNVDKEFSLVLNSSNLKLKKSKVFSDLGPLPDGVYKIRYSIKPNEDLWVEYEYLRVDSLIKSYMEQLADLRVQPCEMNSELKRKIRDLKEIRVYIDAAKAEVEFRHNRQRGIDLYEFANKLLKQFGKKHCLNC